MVVDQVFTDPQKYHSVAWFGSWTTRVEKTTHADSRAAGAVFIVLAIASVLAGRMLVGRVSARHDWIRVATVAVATRAALGTRRFVDGGRAVVDRFAGDDLDAARE